MKRILTALLALSINAGCSDAFETNSPRSWELDQANEEAEADEDPARRFDRDEFEAEVIMLVNERRGESIMCGIEARGPSAPFSMDRVLRRAARHHSHDLRRRNVISHESADGGRFWDRAVAFDGVARGEAVAGGHPSPEHVVEAWIESPGHCLVLLLPEATHVGVGYEFDGKTRFGHFWTLVVGTR